MLEKFLKNHPTETIEIAKAKFKQLFLDYCENKNDSFMLIEKPINAKTEKEIAQVKKINLENAKLTLEVWKLSKENNIPITLDQLTTIVSGTQVLEIPKTSQTITKPESTKATIDGPLDTTRGGFVCRECQPNHFFQFQENDKLDMINKSEEFRGHILQVHYRNLSSLEKSTIMQFLDEVNMK